MEANDIKTVEQAQALPEIEDRMFKRIIETQPDGTTVVKLEMRKLYGRGISGDSILWFIDKDGRSMEVIDSEDGAAKTEIY